MGKGVDAEGGLLNEEDAEDATVDEATEPVAPAETADEGGEDEAHEEDNFEVVTVLPDHHRILIEIGDVGAANPLGILLHQHPPKVGVEEAFADGIWILVGIGISVMGTMVPSPPSNRAFNGTASHGCEEDAKRDSRGIRRVSPKAMVALIDVSKRLNEGTTRCTHQLLCPAQS